MRSKHILIVLSIVAALAAVAVVVSAGNPNTPPGPPETTSSYTLEHIYDRLSTGAAGTQITFTEPISGPTVGTGHTLDEIMGAAPALDNTDGATRTQVMSGTTYWGLRDGAWGLQTGLAAVGGNVTGDDGQLTFAIPDGFYTGSKTATAQDADLVAGNIAQGVDLFGVTGSAGAATGDATPADVLTGTTFSSGSGSGLSGTMPDNGAVTLTPTTTQQTIAAGYHNGSGYVEGDAGLVAGNIKAGVNLFGITGTLSAPVPKTGQTISYTVGDDGDLEMGVEWPIPRFITGTTGIVTDTLTGLIWLENANCFGQSTWTQALTDAATLNSGECGLSDGSVQGDWWLPNVRELQSLAHYGFYTPAVPNTTGTGQWSEADPFSGVQSYYYWSSTMHPYYADNFWSVHLGDGTVVRDLLTAVLYVWPVRGGQ